jgi:hypothetical protein
MQGRTILSPRRLRRKGLRPPVALVPASARYRLVPAVEDALHSLPVELH